MSHRLRMLPFLPFAILFVLTIRVLRPIIAIRLGPIPSILIGNLAPDPEVYLCERDAGMHGRRVVDIFYCQRLVANSQLRKMWTRCMRISQLVSIPDRLNRWLPGGQANIIPMRELQHRDVYGLLADTEPHLSFTKEEEESGAEYLRKSGVPEGGDFVCFHSRGPLYRKAILPERDASHNDYRDSSILNYLPVVEELANKGYFAFRMGAVVEERLPKIHSRIIDYASTDRTEFLDIYLAAKCRFFLGSPTGIAMVPMIFRRPAVLANVIPLQPVHTWGPQDLSIPKKLWLRREERFLTFREILNSKLGMTIQTHQYDDFGVDPVENTPEEIADVTIEMDQRLNGAWESSEEDEELQRRFWSLIEPSELTRVFRSRIGADLLRNNQFLLE